MTELSHLNHFEFGYNDIPFSFRKHVSDLWFVDYGRCQKHPLNFARECVRTAQLIREKTNLKIQVLFSGGVDSEVALRSFVAAQIPVEAAIMKFKNDLNLHDIAWAVVTCDDLGVPYKIYELDILNFWENHSLDYADPTYCISPQLLSTMWLVDQLDGYPVLGSGECLLIRRDAPELGTQPPNEYGENTWELYEKEKIASWYRHFMVRGRDGCPGFFQYSPEIMLAYLWDPFIYDLHNNNLYGKYSTPSTKLLAYQRNFKSLRSRTKYTGFEKIEEHDAKLRSFLTKRFPGCDQIAKTPVPALIQKLSPEDACPQNIITATR